MIFIKFLSMITLNLTNIENSKIQFKTISYPDGQQDIQILGVRNHVPNCDGYTDFEPLNLNTYLKKHSITCRIVSRFNSFKDLELIICATKALRREGAREISLYIPYLLGARSDRQFTKGGTSYLVDVIAPIINSLNFCSVTVMDVHSDVAAACINNLVVQDNVSLVNHALNHIFEGEWQIEKLKIISPDAGSLKKIYNVCAAIQYTGEIICCSKHRSTSGHLSEIKVPKIKLRSYDHKYVIIDDICDGGRTFINIAKIIKERNPNAKVYLNVTHGIFSKGFNAFSGLIDAIYTTNSISGNGNSTEWSIDPETNHIIQINKLDIF